MNEDQDKSTKKNVFKNTRPNASPFVTPYASLISIDLCIMSKMYYLYPNIIIAQIKCSKYKTKYARKSDFVE